MRNVEQALAAPEMEYRPRNYWGWLENITPEETRWQIDRMAEAGLGGYVAHARGGLTMPYAGQQWMDSVRAMIDQGRKYGMVSIIDDEHGWRNLFGPHYCKDGDLYNVWPGGFGRETEEMYFLHFGIEGGIELLY